MDEQFKNAQFEHNPNGIIIVDGTEVAHTKQCGHCGRHVLSMKGSNIVRGWCYRCDSWLCGLQECFVCVPKEKRLEIEEKHWNETQPEREFAVEMAIKKQEALERGGA